MIPKRLILSLIFIDIKSHARLSTLACASTDLTRHERGGLIERNSKGGLIGEVYVLER